MVDFYDAKGNASFKLNLKEDEIRMLEELAEAHFRSKTSELRYLIKAAHMQLVQELEEEEMRKMR